MRPRCLNCEARYAHPARADVREQPNILFPQTRRDVRQLRFAPHERHQMFRQVVTRQARYQTLGRKLTHPNAPNAFGRRLRVVARFEAQLFAQLANSPSHGAAVSCVSARDGSDVLLVARYRVVEVLDPLKGLTLGQPRTPVTPDEYIGNYVVVDFGWGRYAHLARDQP